MAVGIGGALDCVLASMLVHVYEFIYRPGSITDTFMEFNDCIWDVYEGSFFSNIFDVMKIAGLGLLTVAFLIGLYDKTTSGDFSINNFFRHWLKFFMLFTVLMNMMDILENLLGIATYTFSDLNNDISSSITGIDAVKINETMLSNGLYKYIGITSKFGLLMMIVVPYVISILFSVIIGFFAVSRTIEIVVRIGMAPIVVGGSYFGHGQNSDVVRYLKRTMGIFFQIGVVLVIGAGMTVAHGALISSGSSSNTDGGSIANPATYLEDIDTGSRNITVRNLQIEKDDEGNVSKVTETGRESKNAVKAKEDKTPSLETAYTKEAIDRFTNAIVAPENYFVGVGVMISAIFMLLKSREISTKLFG